MDDEFWRNRISNPLAQTFIAMRSNESNEILSSLTLFGPMPLPETLITHDDEAQMPLHWAVNGVWTLPEARRKGISAALSSLAKEWAISQADAAGRDGLLTVLAYEANTSAIALYEKKGFVRCEVREPGSYVQRRRSISSTETSASSHSSPMNS